MINLYPKTLLLLGSGELGKEVAISAKRLGCKVIACDRYSNAPAMQVSDIEEVFNMQDPKELKKCIRRHKPDFVIPEIEALAVDCLAELEEEGFKIIPNSKATKITMNRDRIRDLASKDLGLKTAKYFYASNLNELKARASELGFPLIIKPIMSSSGKGQSFVQNSCDLEKAWDIAIHGARGTSSTVIIEEFLQFDLEITLLTIRQNDGSTLFCPPIGHEQKGGDYQCSWQPAKLNNANLKQAQDMAKKVTEKLGGTGLFGVEFFICGEEVIFSELSPRPHDTGLVTLISQNYSEFELHVRAVLGLPIPEIINTKYSASRVILANNNLSSVKFIGLEKALTEKNTQILLFGKETARKGRRMGVALASGKDLNEARLIADKAAAYVEVIEN